MKHGNKMWASKSHIPLIWGSQIEQHPCDPNGEIPKQRDHVRKGLFFRHIFLVQDKFNTYACKAQHSCAWPFGPLPQPSGIKAVT